MSNGSETHKSSGMKTIDTVLIVAGLVAAAMVGLWAFDAIVGLVLWFFKIVILAIIVVVIVRLLTRRRN